MVAVAVVVIKRRMAVLAACAACSLWPSVWERLRPRASISLAAVAAAIDAVALVEAVHQSRPPPHGGLAAARIAAVAAPLAPKPRKPPSTFSYIETHKENTGGFSLFFEWRLVIWWEWRCGGWTVSSVSLRA